MGQKSEISFSFRGIVNGQHVPVGRIDIRNLDKNCDTTFNWPDTVFSFYPLGINDLQSYPNELHVFQNVPNPVLENTKILVYVPQNGTVTIDVSILSGKHVSSFCQVLNRGFHSFLFTPGRIGTYIFSVNCNRMNKSIKMVVSSSRSYSGIVLIYNGTENETAILKSSKLSGRLAFSSGDNLEFKGYYNGITDTIKDAPTSSKAYTFHFSSTGLCPTSVTHMGQTYGTILIGTQCWFKENLNVGNKINYTINQTNNAIVEKYCYDNLESKCDVYGGLYQWNEMMQYSNTPGIQGICPFGWHLPTNQEWTILSNNLGGESVAGGNSRLPEPFSINSLPLPAGPVGRFSRLSGWPRRGGRPARLPF